MTIQESKNASTLTLSIEGRLDTVSSPELDAYSTRLEGVNELILDCEKLEYISSSGLRVLLKLHKAMNTQGSMKLIHVCEMVMEVFEITAFSDILNIE